MLITSVQNPRVKQVVALRERKQRKRDGLMVVDGYDELHMALECGVNPTTIYVCAEFFHAVDNEGLLRRVRAQGTEVVETNKPVFEKMAYRENPDGWLAVMPLPQLSLADLSLGPNPLLVVVEAVEKPGNLGAILRSADAAGVEAVILCDRTADLGNPNVVRSSRGTVFSVKVVVATSEETLSWLAEHSVQVVAATPEAHTLYTEADLHGPVAVAVGTEREGLSQVWRQASVSSIRIPMHGLVNSLNVAQATTLVLFEAVRQRSKFLSCS